MADNVVLNVPTTAGATIATDDIGGVQHQLVKVEFGSDGVATPVSASDPLPVVQTGTPALPTGAATAANQQTDALTDAQLRAVAVPVSGTFFQATQPVSGTVDVSSLPAGLATSALQQNDALTDTELRASPVPISGTVSTGLSQPVTDAQIRATPLPVSLASLPALAAGTNNIGDVDVLTLPAVTLAAAQTLANVTTVGSITNTVPTKEVRSATPAQTSPAPTNSSTSILSANANRLGATIYNEGAAICYMKLGATASVTSYTLQISVGGYYELPFGYTGAVDGITSAGTAQLRVTELTT